MVQKWCTSCQESTFPLSGVSQQDVCCTLSTMVDGGTTFLGSSKYISDYSLVVNPSSVETVLITMIKSRLNLTTNPLIW